MAKESYVGRAGQLAVMAEFLLRGYNTAIPEVDEGDDIFVVSSPIEELWRIQVKTAIGVERSYGFSGRFQVPIGQLAGEDPTPLYFVFTIRCGERWEFLPISREDLQEQQRWHGMGSRVEQSLVLYLAFKADEVICSGQNWQQYRNNWETWPVIES